MNKTEIAETVDKMGLLKAEMAPLETEYEKLAKKLKALGPNGEYEGNFFRTVVSSYSQWKLNMEAVRAKLSHQFIAKHEKEIKCQKAVVGARQGGLEVVGVKQTAEQALLAAAERMKQTTSISAAA